jgi:uncharacterized protein YcbX
MHLTTLFAHPLKSAGAIELSRAFAGFQGILHDREWLLIKQDGQFLTARSHPKILLIRPTLIPGAVLFSFPGMAAICAQTTQFVHPVRATVWKDTFAAYHGESRLDDWMSQALGINCQLVWLGKTANRPLQSQPYGLSFADGFPYLLINQASLQALNTQIPQAVSARHFRPNIVVNGTESYQEDHWKIIRIGEVIFEITKPCSRCILTTINPDSAEKNHDGEPLRTLAKTRRSADGVYFGVNMIARTQGIIQRGDKLEILETA